MRVGLVYCCEYCNGCQVILIGSINWGGMYRVAWPCGWRLGPREQPMRDDATKYFKHGVYRIEFADDDVIGWWWSSSWLLSESEKCAWRTHSVVIEGCLYLLVNFCVPVRPPSLSTGHDVFQFGLGRPECCCCPLCQRACISLLLVNGLQRPPRSG